MSEPTREEIAWAAGLFEGEGCICWVKKTAAKLSIEMTDRDVLERFAQIVDAGAICDKTCTNPKSQWRASYHWQVYARDDVARILTWFLPWLQSRRGEKARATLERLKHNPGRHIDRTHCPQGHPLTGSNVYRAPGSPRTRHCRTCMWGRYHRLKEAQASG